MIRIRREVLYEAHPGVSTPKAVLRKFYCAWWNLRASSWHRRRIIRNIFHLHNWEYDSGENGFEVVYPTPPSWGCYDCDALLPEDPEPQRWSLFCWYP